MNILITGGYGWIGSNLAKRFYKEGHKVHIIDNLSCATCRSLNFRHKFYPLDIKNSKCEEVFNGTRFDRVIHLAESEGQSLMENLKAVMDLVIAYKIPKFIYLSSTDVYELKEGVGITECEPVRPQSLREIEWVAAENYLELCRQNKGIEIQCLRVSRVYGEHGEGLREWISKESKKTLRDYIYIGDVVDAIYKVSEFSTSSVLNICSYTLADGYLLEGKGTYLEKEGYSNEKAIFELNWIPKYSVKDKKIQALSEEVVPLEAEQKDKVKEKNIKKILPYAENIISFGVITFITVLLQKYHIPPIIDLSLIYIAVISIIYGLNQSVIAIVLSSILYIGSSLSHGQSLVALMYDPNTLLNIGLYIFIGSLLGYIIDSQKAELAEKERTQIGLQEKMKFIYDLYKETVEEKKELEHQITTNQAGVGKVYKAISMLDSLSPDKVFDGAVEVIEELVGVERIAIYMNSEKSPFLRLIAKSNQIGYTPLQSINLKQWEDVCQAMAKNHMYINQSLHSDRPSMMVPVVMGDKMIAVICLDNLGFKQLTLHTKNLVHITCNLITASLIKAYKYEEAIGDQKYVESTIILKPKFFEQILKGKQEGLKKGISNYTLLQIHAPFSIETYEQLKGSIRDVDYLGINEREELFLILSNTDEKGAQFVKDRLAGRHIHATLEQAQTYLTGVEDVTGVAL